MYGKYKTGYSGFITAPKRRQKCQRQGEPLGKKDIISVSIKAVNEFMSKLLKSILFHVKVTQHHNPVGRDHRVYIRIETRPERSHAPFSVFQAKLLSGVLKPPSNPEKTSTSAFGHQNLVPKCGSVSILRN